METFEREILVIFRKGDTIREPIIRFEMYQNYNAAERASKRIRDGWTEIHQLTTSFPKDTNCIYHYYRGFTITENLTAGTDGYEYAISEKNDDITIHHAPVVGYRNAINYINKICYQRKFE